MQKCYLCVLKNPHGASRIDGWLREDRFLRINQTHFISYTTEWQL